MKEIIYNNDNLQKKEIDEIVVRTKGLIINSNNEIILGYSDGVYQFPGGHLIEGESLNECLNREIKEETGIEIDSFSLTPFLKIIHYTKNYRNSGKNRENIIYYFVINTDKKYNMQNSNLDEFEKRGNYTVKVIPLDEVEKVLVNNKSDNQLNPLIVKEMLEALNEYYAIRGL